MVACPCWGNTRSLVTPSPYTGNPLGPGSAGFGNTYEEPDDSDDWDAALINAPSQQLSDNAAFLNAQVQALTFPARNWFQAETFPIAGPYALTFNESFAGVSGRYWIAASFSSGSGGFWNVYFETGTAQGTDIQSGTHQAYGFGPSPISGLAVIPATGVVWACYSYSGVLYHFYNNSGDLATWSASLPDGIVGIVDGTTCIVAFNGIAIAGIYSTTAGNSGLYQLTTSVSIIPLLTGITANGPWVIRPNDGVNSTLCLALVAGAAGSSPQIYSSPDGTTWTANSLASLGLGTGDIVYDVAYNPGAGIWGMVITVSGGGFRCAASSDGQHWTPVGGTHLSGELTTLGVSGYAWVSFLDYGSAKFQMVYSFDLVTWQFSNYEISNGGVNVLPLIAQSTSQLGVSWRLGTQDTNLPMYRFAFESGGQDTEVG